LIKLFIHKTMKKLLFCSCLYFSIISLSCSQSQKEINFNSNEELMKYFIQNIKVGKFENVLKTSIYYYDEIIEKLNAKEQLLRSFSIDHFTQPNLPKEYGSLTKAILLGDYASKVQYFISSLLLPKEFNNSLKEKSAFSFNDALSVDKYMSNMGSLDKLNSLEFVRMDVSYPEFQFSESFKQMNEFTKLVYNFDESVEYLVLLKFENNYYTGDIKFARYGKNWYIFNLYSPFAGTSLLGTLEQVSGIEEYLYNYKIKN